MKQLLILAITQVALVFNAGATPDLSTQHGVGNGGDFVRAHFIKKGTQIRNFLANTEKGQEFAREFNLRVYSFDSVLNTRVIVLSESQLYDNFNQPVDAIFENGQIHLYAQSWQKYLSFDSEIYMMIFHEMLRATTHYDDDFIISKHLKLEVSNEEIEDQPDQPLTNISCECKVLKTNYYQLTCAAQNEVLKESFNLIENYITHDRCEMAKIRVLEANGQDSGAYRVNVDRYDTNTNYHGKKVDFKLNVTGKEVSFGFYSTFFSIEYMLFPSGSSQSIWGHQYDELFTSLSFIDLGQTINLIILDGYYIGFEVVD